VILSEWEDDLGKGRERRKKKWEMENKKWNKRNESKMRKTF